MDIHKYIRTYGAHYTRTYIHTYIRLVSPPPLVYPSRQARKAACHIYIYVFIYK